MPIRISPAWACGAAPGRSVLATPAERAPPRKRLRFMPILLRDRRGPRVEGGQDLRDVEQRQGLSGPLDPAGHQRARSAQTSGRRAVGDHHVLEGLKPEHGVHHQGRLHGAIAHDERPQACARDVIPAVPAVSRTSTIGITVPRRFATPTRCGGAQGNRGDLVEDHHLAGASHVHREPRPGEGEQTGARRRRGIRSSGQDAGSRASGSWALFHELADHAEELVRGERLGQVVRGALSLAPEAVALLVLGARRTPPGCPWCGDRAGGRAAPRSRSAWASRCPAAGGPAAPRRPDPRGARRDRTTPPDGRPP